MQFQFKGSVAPCSSKENTFAPQICWQFRLKAPFVLFSLSLWVLALCRLKWRVQSLWVLALCRLKWRVQSLWVLALCRLKWRVQSLWVLALCHLKWRVQSLWVLALCHLKWRVQNLWVLALCHLNWRVHIHLTVQAEGWLCNCWMVRVQFCFVVSYLCTSLSST